MGEVKENRTIWQNSHSPREDQRDSAIYQYLLAIQQMMRLPQEVHGGRHETADLQFSIQSVLTGFLVPNLLRICTVRR